MESGTAATVKYESKFAMQICLANCRMPIKRDGAHVYMSLGIFEFQILPPPHLFLS